MKQLSIDNITYRIGTNAKENWNLLEKSKPTDILFHLRIRPKSFAWKFLLADCNHYLALFFCCISGSFKGF